MTDDIDRRVLLAARGWLGTPYRHQGSSKGVGCDCLGLLRGIWRELRGPEPEAPGAYATTWSLRAGPDRLLAAATRHLAAIPIADARPGDVLLFRWRASAPATHCAVVDEDGRIIHAYEGAAVVSTALPRSWRGRIAGAFRFPE
ncbi:NlpC/P60 family protein [Aurantimonas sp. 22II-16-19i]|uniref:NlpC/P60 family protein n=1 Tax=Aurantimonas sp. 22II-16-19i TaxID=1317114 RepID=UPI0009F7FFB8|nr:NlpC/P60 family protein [Aurantimonas sp. 22II-16-19i]ORE87842.1 NlpC/P60 family phage cell wall peptidase [Aurantimonas sp. 22II-16-19i]